MLINLNEFQKVLKKATLNYSIDTVLLNVIQNKITSSMKSTAKDAFAILDLPNTVISDMKKDMEFTISFSDPKVNVIPFINLIQEEQVKFVIRENKMVIDGQVTICFDDPSIMSSFSGKNVQDDMPVFSESKIDESFQESINKIKKIGNKFGKVYFIVDNKKFYIETSDRTNSFSNKLQLYLFDVDFKDVVLCFNYRNFHNLISIINGDYEKYIMSFSYFDAQELGTLYCVKEDETEKYLLTSVKED